MLLQIYPWTKLFRQGSMTVHAEATDENVVKMPVYKNETEYEEANITMQQSPIEIGDNSFELILSEAKTLDIAGYTVTYKDAVNGVISGVTSSAPNDKVTLTIKPNTGYELDTISASDDTGNVLSISGSGYTYYFTINKHYCQKILSLIHF